MLSLGTVFLGGGVMRKLIALTLLVLSLAGQRRSRHGSHIRAGLCVRRGLLHLMDACEMIGFALLALAFVGKNWAFTRAFYD